MSKSFIRAVVTAARRERLTYAAFNEACKLARKQLRLTRPRTPHRLPQLIPPDALARFYTTIDRAGNLQHQIMLRLLFYTAIRISELCNIETGHVSLEECKIFIEQGKGAKDRYILFPESFRLPLTAHMRANPRNRYLFESNRRSRYSERQVQRIVKDYAREAEIPVNVHPHLFRHQCLSFLTRAGLSDAQIQLISGHASKKSLEVYQHLTLEDVAEDYQAAMRRIGV